MSCVSAVTFKVGSWTVGMHLLTGRFTGQGL